MKSKLINDASGQKTFAFILDKGDEVLECLKRFARAQNLSAAGFSAIGAFERAELAYFDWDTRRYCAIPIIEQVEVASLTGDIVLGDDGEPLVHMHAVLGLRNGAAMAGHLNSGLVRPTLEIILTESPAYLRKRADPVSGIPLIDPAAS